MKLKLIDDWRTAHHLGSVQVSAGMAAVFGLGPELLSAWGSMPDDLKSMLPHGWAHVIATAGFLLVLLSRIFRKDDQH